MRIPSGTFPLACLFLLLANMLCAQVQSRDTVVQDTLPPVLYSIRGCVTGGGGGEQETLPGAYIYVGEEKTPVMTTDEEGRFLLKGLPRGEVRLSISYIGYETFSALFRLEKDLDVGEIRLRTVLLDEVLVEAKLPIATRHGDTTKFNADAVKVAADADIEALIKKLPGFEIVDGKIIAQGKEVTRLYIDGQEYALNDPAASLKDLPAKLVKKIALFDKRSDEAEFSGYDDGTKYRSINIETRDPNRPKLFGQGEAGYGITAPVKNTFRENNYRGDLSGSYFSPRYKHSFSARAENAGVQTGFPESRLGGEDGFNRSQSVFVNSSSKINDHLGLTVSYNLSGNGSESASMSRQEYFPTENYDTRLYDSENRSRNSGTNHMFRTRVKYEPNKRNHFIFAPIFSRGKSDSRSETYAANIEDGDTLNLSHTANRNAGERLSIGSTVLWMHAFGKRGRTFSLNLSGNYNKSRSDQYQNNKERALSSPGTYADTVRNIASANDQRGYSYSLAANFNEPLSEHARLGVNYVYSENTDRSDRNSLAYADEAFSRLIGIDSSQTNALRNTHRTHSYGIRYTHTIEKLNLNAGMTVNHTRMDNRYRYLGQADSIAVSRYTDLSPMLSMNYKYSDAGSLDLGYTGYSNSPTVTQLQDVLDISSPLQVSKGNPSLKKSYSHNVSLNYTHLGSEAFSLLYGTLGFGQTFNSISNNTKFIERDTVINGYALARGASLSTPVNLNGSWNLSCDLSYSFPWEALKLRFSTSCGYSFSHTPSIYDDLRNMNTSHVANLSASVSTNFSEDFDADISANHSASFSRNTSTGNARYNNTNLSAYLNWVFWKGFYLNASYNGSFNISRRDTRVLQDEHLLAAEIGKKFGKERRLAVALSARDLLQNRRTMHYSLTDLYSSTSYNTVPSTCYLLTLSYRFDNIKKGDVD